MLPLSAAVSVVAAITRSCPLPCHYAVAPLAVTPLRAVIGLPLFAGVQFPKPCFVAGVAGLAGLVDWLAGWLAGFAAFGWAGRYASVALPTRSWELRTRFRSGAGSSLSLIAVSSGWPLRACVFSAVWRRPALLDVVIPCPPLLPYHPAPFTLLRWDFCQRIYVYQSIPRRSSCRQDTFVIGFPGGDSQEMIIRHLIPWLSLCKRIVVYHLIPVPGGVPVSTKHLSFTGCSRKSSSNETGK